MDDKPKTDAAKTPETAKRAAAGVAEKKLDKLIARQDYDDDVAEFVRREVLAGDNVDKIISGELVLPSPTDAARAKRVADGKEQPWHPPQRQ